MTLFKKIYIKEEMKEVSLHNVVTLNIGAFQRNLIAGKGFGSVTSQIHNFTIVFVASKLEHFAFSNHACLYILTEV